MKISKINFPIKSIYGLKSDLTQFSDKPITEIVDCLEQDGVNAVFGGFDNAELYYELKKRNILVFASIAIFAGLKYWDSNPESRPVLENGILMEKEKWYGGLCPSQNWLRNIKLNEIKKLATEYHLDGIWLDFIRYPCHWEGENPLRSRTCFCPVCLSKFQFETNIKIPDKLTSITEKSHWILKNHLVKWNRFRCDNITTFVKEARFLIKSISSDILLGLFSVPWQTKDFDNAIIEIIGQDYLALAEFIDLISPMVYHKLCYRTTDWIHDITKYTAQITGIPVVPIIQACSIPDKLDNREFGDTLNKGLLLPSGGVIIFNLDYALKENKMDIIKEIFTGVKL